MVSFSLEFKVVSEPRCRKLSLSKRFKRFSAASANAGDIMLWKPKEAPKTSVHFKEIRLNDLERCLLQREKAPNSEGLREVGESFE
jgi:hypothetical protein